ncbi:hypothetical protein HOP50_09g55920 [Chloropicon primus]|uniref:Uncharacterized protein n=1 Tax=Chloropicon primus TaxID=1764295 RepID=A0A5B8MRL6_9CHLO|nr:hypothetical protein A3770_09p55690 [Chloropicon primus]UPR02266.1 hypothetical protein HOP50_09g55920 [Chloropicon primus]|eukprot:QDZ23051.1 hypothetical protein A3770_09p55690 [Chloropicon primus]
MFVYSLCLVLIVFEVVLWSQTSLPNATAGTGRRKTVASELKSLQGGKEHSRITQYLVQGLDLPVAPLSGSDRVVLKDDLTREELSLLLLTEDDQVLFKKLLPNNTSGLRHNTCALVGNSVSLLSEERGGEIDRHQAVLRFIDSTSTKYDAHAGRKRTYLAVTEGSIDAFIPESGFDKAKRPRSKALLIHGDVPVQDYAELRKSQPDVQAYYLSPVFDLRVRKAYRTIMKRAMSLGETFSDDRAALDEDGMPWALMPLFFLTSICKIVFVYGFTAPVAATDLFGPTYYGQAQSVSEHPHGTQMQYLLRVLSMEGLGIELVS